MKATRVQGRFHSRVNPAPPVVSEQTGRQEAGAPVRFEI
ncbi:hypothetical protein BH10CYA1_BH10CYA1_12120 [soil metagenome]